MVGDWMTWCCLSCACVSVFQVPDDLGVAVGMLVERLMSHMAEGRNETQRSKSDRNNLLKELNTLTEEKVSRREAERLQSRQMEGSLPGMVLCVHACRKPSSCRSRSWPRPCRGSSSGRARSRRG